jgi:hypothetical protein
MFTLRFFKDPYENGALSNTVVCAKSYQNYTRPDGSHEVVLFESMVQVDGVAYNVSKDEKDFQHCYVENSEGKTIDHIKHTSHGVALAAS